MRLFMTYPVAVNFGRSITLGRHCWQWCRGSVVRSRVLAWVVVLWTRCSEDSYHRSLLLFLVCKWSETFNYYSKCRETRIRDRNLLVKKVILSAVSVQMLYIVVHSDGNFVCLGPDEELKQIQNIGKTTNHLEKTWLVLKIFYTHIYTFQYKKRKKFTYLTN